MHTAYRTDDTSRLSKLARWLTLRHEQEGKSAYASTVSALAQRAGLECSIERFGVEDDFELAHPNWVG
jgi:hypothetical protein